MKQLIKIFSSFISVCIAIFDSLINITIGLFFGYMGATYIWNPLFYFVLFVALVYSIYSSISIYQETYIKTYNYLSNK